METLIEANEIDVRIAERLKALRTERGWSLDELARLSGVSRATLSRLENAEVSPTASVLNRLCNAFGLTLSRLMHLAEADFTPLLRRETQPIWTDTQSGFERRAVSPPTQTLAGEVLECRLEPASRIDYEVPPRDGLEHHLVLAFGRLAVTVGSERHELKPGDCLRYRLFGPSSFETPADSAARYFLFIV